MCILYRTSLTWTRLSLKCRVVFTTSIAHVSHLAVHRLIRHLVLCLPCSSTQQTPIQVSQRASREARANGPGYVSWPRLGGPFQGLGALLPLATYSFTVTDILLVLFLLNVRGMMRHEGRFVWLIGNHHLLHHRHPQYNYGEYWLDRLCGTLYPNREEAIAGLLYM